MRTPTVVLAVLLTVAFGWHVEGLNAKTRSKLQFEVELPQAAGWTTNRNEIKAPNGQSVILKSIAWFGFETANFVVHGIWTRNMEDLLRLIKGLGFNSIRIPWSNDIMKNPMPNGINYSANPNLNGKKSLEVLDYMIDRCAEIGLWVILDRHRPNKDGQS